MHIKTIYVYYIMLYPEQEYVTKKKKPARSSANMKPYFI